MPLTIGSNISSLKAQRRLSEGTSSLSKIYERLSSGQRINRASDDAAGLSVAETLNTDKRVFNQGVRNLNDGISLLNIADGALEQLSNISTRLQELAAQSANGSYSVTQRKALDAEAQALAREHLRIVQSTTFNGRQLFSGGFGTLSIQAGYGVDGGIQSGLGGAVGAGTFGAGISSLQGLSPASDSLKDLNGDGILDLITAGTSAGTGYASVSLGIGDGTFGTATTYVMDSGGTTALSVGDLNGDGVLDLVTAGAGQTSIRLGRGDGTFGASSSYAMSGGALALGDFNGDGVLDMVTTRANTVNVRLGTGIGTFGANATYIDGSPDLSYVVAVADLDSDGILDMVTSNYTGGSMYLSVRRGLGNGTFSSATSFTHAVATSIALGDLNGDGIPDIVTGDSTNGVGTISVRLGTGRASFGSSTQYTFGFVSSNSVALGDLNGDGILDIVSAKTGITNGYVEFSLGKGDGTFNSFVTFAAEGTGTASVALGDINGDGVLDIVTAGTGGGSGRTTAFTANTNYGVSALLSFSLSTRADALQALSQFAKTQSRLSTQRGIIGAYQSRLIVAGNVLQSTADNYSQAGARVKDVDIADESAKLVRTEIIQKAASAVLAQANLQPQITLSLLKQ